MLMLEREKQEDLLESFSMERNQRGRGVKKYDCSCSSREVWQESWRAVKEDGCEMISFPAHLIYEADNTMPWGHIYLWVHKNKQTILPLPPTLQAFWHGPVYGDRNYSSDERWGGGVMRLFFTFGTAVNKIIYPPNLNALGLFSTQ